MIRRAFTRIAAALVAAVFALAGAGTATAVWSVPDKGTGQSDFQSIPYQVYFDGLLAGVGNTDVVLTGCAVTPQGSPDMTVQIARCAVNTAGVYKLVAASSSTAIGTAHASLPRIDLVVVTSSGAFAVRAGTAAAVPKPPARTANDVLLGFVYIPATDTTISSDQIVDLRTPAPATIAISLAADASSNSTTTAAEITGLTIPVGVGTWHFTYVVRYQSAATTTGVKFGVDHSGTTTSFLAQSRYASTGGAAATAAATQAGASATGNIHESFSTRTKGAILTPTVSVDAANSDMLMIVEGLVVVSVAGDLKLMHGSEVAAASTVKSGSSLVLVKTG